MPESLVDLVEALSDLAAYRGSWRALREETPLLARRVEELRERADRLDDLLVVALVGGSGVGKSTLLNAVAGDQIAETSEMRPCTDAPVVYHPPGARLDFGEGRYVARSALEHLVLIDTPDSDTVVKQHREQTRRVLDQCDVILLCATAEKYLDEATWSLLRPLRGQRTLVCVETKAREKNDITAHWAERLREAGFDIPPDLFFRVNALHAFDRKLAGNKPEAAELDFPKLEGFLRHELTRERIARIKRSNVAGLLSKMVARLHERVSGMTPAPEELRNMLETAGRDLAKEAFRCLERRVFAEPHLWRFAVGREMSVRARGGAGLLFRCIEALRGLPVRLPQLLPWNPGQKDDTHRAVALLTEGGAVEDDVRVATDAVENVYRAKQSEVGLAFSRAGLDPVGKDDGLEAFQAELARRVTDLLRGPARDRVVRGACFLTSWPVALLADLPTLMLVVYAGCHIFTSYFKGVYLDTAFFYHTAALLALLLTAEYVVLSTGARWIAWRARRAGCRDLLQTLNAPPGLGFQLERALLDEVARLRDVVERLRRGTQTTSN